MDLQYSQLPATNTLVRYTVGIKPKMFGWFHHLNLNGSSGWHNSKQNSTDCYGGYMLFL